METPNEQSQAQKHPLQGGDEAAPAPKKQATVGGGRASHDGNPLLNFFPETGKFNFQHINEAANPQKVAGVVGAAYGDEGKGKIVALLGGDFDIVARCFGGANAGHTVKINGKTFKFNLLPSGAVHPHITCVLGQGVSLDVEKLFAEIDAYDDAMQGGMYAPSLAKRVKVSLESPLNLRLHKLMDAHNESCRANRPQSDDKSEGAIGTTGRGIGPCYATHATRDGLRLVDLLGNPVAFRRKHEYLYKQYSPISAAHDEQAIEKEQDKLLELGERIVSYDMPVSCADYMNCALGNGKHILVEGANAIMIDPYVGRYPNCTSGICTTGGFCVGLGIPPQVIGSIVHVFKAYCTKVGEGAFPTELLGDGDDVRAELIRERGGEYGTTTKRPRRIGYLDIMHIRQSIKINGPGIFAMNKIDILRGIRPLKICVGYTFNGKEMPDGGMPVSEALLARVAPKYIELDGWDEDISHIRDFDKLPPAAIAYIKKIESLIDSRIAIIGVGPAQDEVIYNM